MNQTFNHLIWLGADTANYPAGIIEKCESATLIEARSEACDLLQQRFCQNNVSVLQLAVSANINATQKFYEYDLPSYSSLHQATGLKSIFPSIKIVKQTSVACIPISQIVSELNIHDGKNALIIDLIDQSYDIVKSLHAAELLQKFKSIFIQTSTSTLYEGAPSTQTIIALLEQLNYRLEEKSLDDPDLPFLSFSLDASAILVKKNIDLEKSLKDAEKLNKLLEDKVSKSDKKIIDLQAQLSEVNKKLEIANQTQQITKSINNIQNSVSKTVTNAVKQIEDFISLQNYLERGVKPLSFHGWPISPDIGLYLTSLIDSNEYDLIIEFGSGTSSVLMAKALATKDKNKTSGTQKGNDSTPRIISFEHNSFYHEKTAAALCSNKVDHLVDLVHASLVDYEYSDGSKYLYYNCDQKLSEISMKLSNKRANILVLVDGPPGATNKNARFPALPHILKHLSGHKFTILMDDYNRPEEKEIVLAWTDILNKRNIENIVISIHSEKGLADLKIL